MFQNQEICFDGKNTCVEFCLPEKALVHVVKHLIFFPIFRDEIEGRNKLFEKNPVGFYYNKASGRGWQKKA